MEYAREPELILSTTNLNQLAQQVIDLTRARWSDMPQQRGIVVEMRTEFAPDLPTICARNAERLRPHGLRHQRLRSWLAGIDGRL